MKTKKLEQILSSFEEFEQLNGMLLLFDKNSKYYKWSGFVTAALLDYEEQDNQKITILALNTGHLSGWLTIRRTKEELVDLLNNCIEFVGKDEESSFILEK